jgi:CBS domain containing-hemolysin-like protein
MNVAEGFIISFLVLIAGSYIIPHLLYRRSTGQWLTPLTPILRVLAIIFRPLTALMQFLESLYELSEPESDDDKPVSPAEEIEALISAGEEEGIIQKEDRRLIQSVVEFGDKRVSEVMTPRRDIVAIEASKTLADLRVLVLNERFSRIPV